MGGIMAISVFRSCCARTLSLISIIAFSTLGHAGAEDLRISVTPRFWYAYSGGSDFVPCTKNEECIALQTLVRGPVEILVTSESNPSAVIAGTIGIGGGWLGASDFNLTVFDGTVENAFINTATVTSIPGLSTIVHGSNETHRTQIEALLLLPPLSDSARFFLGATISSAETTTTFDRAFNSFNVIVGKPTVVGKIEGTSYTPFVGMRTNTYLTDDKKHAVFANFQGMAGPTYTKSTDLLSKKEINTSEWVGGIDTSAGYQYQIQPDLIFSTRYRVIIQAPLDDWSANGNSLSHGPEFSITYKIQ
jgi:hypothetical protein